jgi:hypothetical protein
LIRPGRPFTASWQDGAQRTSCLRQHWHQERRPLPASHGRQSMASPEPRRTEDQGRRCNRRRTGPAKDTIIAAPPGNATSGDPRGGGNGSPGKAGPRRAGTPPDRCAELRSYRLERLRRSCRGCRVSRFRQFVSAPRPCPSATLHGKTGMLKARPKRGPRHGRHEGQTSRKHRRK